MIDLNSQNFDDVVSHKTENNVVVMWRSESSVLVNTTAIQLEEAMKTVKKPPTLAQIDIDKCPDVAMRFSIRHIPYLMLFINGMLMVAEPDLTKFLAGSHLWIN